MRVLIFCILIVIPGGIMAQGSLAEAKFHEGSNLFINGNQEGALSAVTQGLKADPQNQKLQALKKLLDEQKKKDEEKKKKEEQQKKQEQKNKEQQDKQNKDKKNEDQKKDEQQKKEQEQKEQEKKEQEKKEKEEQEKKDQEEKQEKDEKEKDDFDPEVKQRLEEMKMDPEKARMLLEAMRNQEIQYLQQQKREQSKKRDPSMPDW